MTGGMNPAGPDCYRVTLTSGRQVWTPGYESVPDALAAIVASTDDPIAIYDVPHQDSREWTLTAYAAIPWEQVVIVEEIDVYDEDGLRRDMNEATRTYCLQRREAKAAGPPPVVAPPGSVRGAV